MAKRISKENVGTLLRRFADMQSRAEAVTRQPNTTFPIRLYQDGTARTFQLAYTVLRTLTMQGAKGLNDSGLSTLRTIVIAARSSAARQAGLAATDGTLRQLYKGEMDAGAMVDDLIADYVQQSCARERGGHIMEPLRREQ